MSIAAVRDYFAQFGMADNVLEFSTSSATVELAAQAAGVIPARIAKTLSFLVDAEMWVMFMAVPTVLSPGARWGAMEVQAAFSIRAVIKGVP